MPRAALCHGCHAFAGQLEKGNYHMRGQKREELSFLEEGIVCSSGFFIQTRASDCLNISTWCFLNIDFSLSGCFVTGILAADSAEYHFAAFLKCDDVAVVFCYPGEKTRTIFPIPCCNLLGMHMTQSSALCFSVAATKLCLLTFLCRFLCLSLTCNQPNAECGHSRVPVWTGDLFIVFVQC